MYFIFMHYISNLILLQEMQFKPNSNLKFWIITFPFGMKFISLKEIVYL